MECLFAHGNSVRLVTLLIGTTPFSCKMGFTGGLIFSLCCAGVSPEGNGGNESETEIHITAALVELNDESDIDDTMVHDDDDEGSYEVDENDGPLGKVPLD